MSMAVFWLISVNSPDNHAKDGCLSALKREVCQNILVPAPRAGPQKNRPYQSDIYTVSFHAIPRQAREQGSFDTPPLKGLEAKPLPLWTSVPFLYCI